MATVSGIRDNYAFLLNFPGGPATNNPSAKREMEFRYLGQENHLEKKRHPTPVFLPGKSLTEETSEPQSLGSQKSQTRLRD